MEAVITNMTYTFKHSSGILLIKHGVLYTSEVMRNTWIGNMYPSAIHAYRGTSKGRKWRPNTFGAEFSWLEFLSHPIRSFARIYKILRHP